MRPAICSLVGIDEAPKGALGAKHGRRLWRGPKTAQLSALTEPNLFQVNGLLERITVVLYQLRLFALVFHGSKTGMAYAPKALLGTYASGVA